MVAVTGLDGFQASLEPKVPWQLLDELILIPAPLPVANSSKHQIRPFDTPEYSSIPRTPLHTPHDPHTTRLRDQGTHQFVQLPLSPAHLWEAPGGLAHTVLAVGNPMEPPVVTKRRKTRKNTVWGQTAIRGRSVDLMHHD